MKAECSMNNRMGGSRKKLPSRCKMILVGIEKTNFEYSKLPHHSQKPILPDEPE